MRLGTVRVVAAALVLLGSASLSAEAQSPRTPRIGLLSTGTDPGRPLVPQWVAFLDALRALGYIEGQNVLIERRFAGGDGDRIPQFAAELARLKVDVLVVTGLREIHAARQATASIPIVTIVAPDLEEAGYIASLARPGGNVTGHRLPAIYTTREYVELGGLMAYGPSFVDHFRRAPVFVDNLKTARALGLHLPPALLARADEVLQ